MLLRITNSLLLVLYLSASAVAQDFMSPQPGEWSANSIRLWPVNVSIDQRPSGVVVKSPRSRYAFTVTVKDLSEVKLTDLAKQKVVGTFPLMNLSLSEILWSPDERTFALTQSDGGWVGTWNLSIGQISDEGTLSFLNEIDKVILADFKKRILPKDCADEYPNVAAVAWVDSNKLLLVGEVPPHSSCSKMSAIFGYVVEIPSEKILNRIDENTLSNEWKAWLGPRLKKK